MCGKYGGEIKHFIITCPINDLNIWLINFKRLTKTTRCFGQLYNEIIIHWW